MISVDASKKILCIVASAAIAIFAVCVLALSLEAYGLLVELRTAVSNASNAATATIWQADKAIGALAGAGVAAINGIRDETLTIARDMHAKADAAYVIANKTNASTAAASTASYRMLRRLEVDLMGEQQAHPPAQQPILSAVRESIQGSSRTWGSVQTALTGIDSQIAENGKASRELLTRAGETILHVDQSLVRLDAPVQAAALNIQDTTLHVAESTRSVDEALRPLRRVEGRAKAWIKILAGFFRVAVPIW